MTRNRYTATNIDVRNDERRKAGLHIYASVKREHDLLPTMPVITRRGDDPLVDAAWDAYNAAEIALRRVALPEVIERALNVDHDEAVRLAAATRYVRKLGCPCGCSPGFVLKDDRARAADYRTWRPAYLTVYTDLVAIEARGWLLPIEITYEGEAA